MLNRWQNKHPSLLNTWLATNTQWVCEDRFKYSLETGSSSIRLHTDSWTRTALFKASQAFSTGSRSELSSQWKQAFLCIFPSTRHYFSLKYIFFTMLVHLNLVVWDFSIFCYIHLRLHTSKEERHNAAATLIIQRKKKLRYSSDQREFFSLTSDFHMF